MKIDNMEIKNGPMKGTKLQRYRKITLKSVIIDILLFPIIIGAGFYAGWLEWKRKNNKI